MKDIKKIKDSDLLFEILNFWVSERSDLMWSVGFDEEMHKQIVEDLITNNPISEN